MNKEPHPGCLWTVEQKHSNSIQNCGGEQVIFFAVRQEQRPLSPHTAIGRNLIHSNFYRLIRFILPGSWSHSSSYLTGSGHTLRNPRMATQRDNESTQSYHSSGHSGAGLTRPDQQLSKSNAENALTRNIKFEQSATTLSSKTLYSTLQYASKTGVGKPSGSN